MAAESAAQREWRVTGMDCGSCAAKVRGAVERLPGVADVDVALMAERLRLEILETREEIDYEIALDALKMREIDAPLSGQVVERLLDEGEACGAQEPLLRIVDSSRCYFTSNIDARLGPRFRLDQEVTLEVQSGTGHVNITGKVSFISPVVDPSSGLLKIRLLFDNKDGKVRPGVEGRMIIPAAR